MTYRFLTVILITIGSHIAPGMAKIVIKLTLMTGGKPIARPDKLIRVKTSE